MEKFYVCYRSVCRESASACVRPDNVQILIQQDYRLSDDSNLDNKNKPQKLVMTGPKGPTGRMNVGKNHLFRPALCNVYFPFDKYAVADTWIKSVTNGIWEAYICEEDRDEIPIGSAEAQSIYEDGRSRRYIVRSNLINGIMVSHDIKDSGLPIRFSYISNGHGIVINKTSLIWYTTILDYVIENAVVILHGANESWFTFQKKEEANIKMMEDSVLEYFKHAEITKQELEKWYKQDQKKRTYTIILCKDHKLRYPHFNYRQLYEKFGKRWNMPKPEVAISDAVKDPQWWETLGVSCSKEISFDICIQHMDDHCPVLFTFIMPGIKAMSSKFRRCSKEYYITDKWRGEVTFKTYANEENINDIIEEGENP